MKKLLTVCLCSVWLLSMTACTGTVSKAEYDAVVAERDALRQQLGIPTTDSKQNTNAKTASKNIPTRKFDETTILEQLQITTYEYRLFNSHSNYFIVIKNNSEHNLSIDAKVIGKDAEGKMIAAKNSSVTAFEKGTETVLHCYFHDETPKTFEYDLSVKESLDDCVVSNLSYEYNIANNKIITSITNNGEDNAEFVEGIALFFDGDTLVGHDRQYFTDADSEIKSGETIIEELTCFEDFDNVKVYLSGRK